MILQNQIGQLYKISQKDTRRIIGLMSGTSIDGLDIAICNVEGYGTGTKLQVEYFVTIPYAQSIKKNILKVFAKKRVDFQHLCQLNSFLGIWYGKQINAVLQEQKLDASSIDLIGSHGQTVQHIPYPTPFYDGNSTFQIGDGDHIAAKTGIITISDFRQKHVAHGGEGAPLAYYADRILFSHSTENRVMLNMGGIANFTFLPSEQSHLAPFTTDTGPANTLIDQYCQKYLNINFDFRGNHAIQGHVNVPLLTHLKSHPFFKQKSPKSTGQETFHLSWVEDILHANKLNEVPKANILATLSQLTVDTIAAEIFKTTKKESFTLVPSGGGTHNDFIMAGLKNALFRYSKFTTLTDLGVHPDAKEAVMFAILANEAVANPNQTFLPGLGKKFPMVSFGKISLPD